MRELAVFSRFLKMICREAEIVLPWRRNGKGCSKTNVCRVISKFPERNFFVANWAIHFTEWTNFLVKITSCWRKFGSAAMYSKFALLQKLLTRLARNITVTKPKTLAESASCTASSMKLKPLFASYMTFRTAATQAIHRDVRFSALRHPKLQEIFMRK